MQISKSKAVFLFSLVILIWGFNWTVVKLIVLEIPPVWSAALRSAIAAAVVLPLQRATGDLRLPEKRDLSVILCIGVFNMTLCPLFMAAGLELVPVGRSVVLGYTTPLWVAPGAWLFLREPLPLRRLLGVAAGLCGIAILCNPSTLDWGDSRAVLGYVFLLLSALSWAVAILCIRRHVWRATPFQLLFWQTLLASVLLILLALSVHGPLSFYPSLSLLLLLAYCGIPGTALAFWALTVINASLPATTVSLGLLATPLVGILGSVVFLDEGVDLSMAVSIFLVLGGIALGSSRQGREKSG
ncbi:MAG: DMT family transporter [Deltaproteobacteria bacterium]|jgi:drug/metabolite transporter (DMT)-like permease|nr:DMT family transporter [Deltaproteobacteria bacterium]